MKPESLAGADRDAPVARSGAILLGILVLALVARLPGFTEPFSGQGFNSFLGAYGTAAFARHFDEYGFAQSGFLPWRWQLELQDGSVERDYYVHHPAGYAILTGLVVRVLGDEEWVARLPWLIVALFSVYALFLFTRDVWGERVALMSAGVYALLPFAAHYALMTWVDNGAMLAVYCLLLRHYVRWVRAPEARHLRRTALWVVIGALTDWTVGFVVLGIGLHALGMSLKGRLAWAGLRSTLLLPGAFLLGFVIHGVHLAIVLPWNTIVHDTFSTLERTTSLQISAGEYLANQFQHVRGGLSWGILVVFLLGAGRQVARALRGRLQAEEAVLLALALPGPLYVACFPFRGATHDFLWNLSLGWFAISAGLELLAWRRWLQGRLGRAAPVVFVPLLIGLASWCALGMHEKWRKTSSHMLVSWTEQDWYARSLADPSAIVLGPLRIAQLLYYCDATLFPRITRPAQLDELRTKYFSRLAPGRRILYLFVVEPAALANHGALRERLRGLAGVETFAEGQVELYDLTDWAYARSPGE